MLHTLGRGLGCGQRLPRREGLWGAHLSSSPTTPSPGKAGGKKGKGGERSFRRALRVARPGEVGLAVSRNDPSVLRAAPSCSSLENPLERPGALPAAWENVFPELEGVISSLPSHSGCGLHSLCPGLQAPERNPARPLALLAKPPPGAGDSPGKRRQRSCRITERAVRCAGEGIREGFLEEATPKDQVEISQKTNGG